MADEPIPSLGRRTPLQAARKPDIDRLAALGRNGLLDTIPEGFAPGSEIANLSILGYDLPKVFEGRGSLEAASMGIGIEDGEMAMRCNLITIEDGKILNHSGGQISSEEAAGLIGYLQKVSGGGDVNFFAGVSYRNLLKMKGGNKHILTTPPHDIIGRDFKDYLIKPGSPESKATADRLNGLILESMELLPRHPINEARRKAGKCMANCIWPTGLYDTNYEGKAAAALEALKNEDFVFLHIEASDEAGHDGDPELKVRTIEYLNDRIVRPVMSAIRDWEEDISIAILPDHPTPCAIRTHTAAPVPFAIYRTTATTADKVMKFDEFSAAEGEYGLMAGRQFIELFINGD